MKFLNIAKQAAALAIISAAYTACEGPADANEVFGGGRTIVKLLDAGPVDDPGIRKLAIDFVTTPTTLVGADVRRDVPNPTELNKSMTVIVKDDTAAVSLAGLTKLDPAWYTVGSATPKTGGEGGTYTVTLAPGEFAKPINIIIPDATVLDPSETYGLGFTIMSADANGVLSALRTVVIEIGAKNKYDGIYEMHSIHNRSPYQFNFVTEMHMVTTGASTVRFYWPDAGSFGHPIGTSPTTLSWYGAAIGPAVVFDPATNLVTDVYNAGGTVAIRLATPPAAPVSRYDEATRTMYIYWYYFTGANQDFSNRGWSDTLYYVGPR